MLDCCNIAPSGYQIRTASIFCVEATTELNAARDNDRYVQQKKARYGQQKQRKRQLEHGLSHLDSSRRHQRCPQLEKANGSNLRPSEAS